VSDRVDRGGLDPRTQRLLEAPIVPTLLRLGAPNVLIMLAQAGVGLIETFFVGKLGTDALAGMALVFPAVMLMQTISAGAFGGAIASVIARALGGGRRAEADALVLHSLAIALALGMLFMVAALAGGRWLFTRMGGAQGALVAAMTYSNLVFAGAALVWIFNSLSAVIRGSGNMTVPALVSCTGSVLVIGVAAALWPNAWLSLFASDHAMREAGAHYLHAVGPLYGFFGVGLVLYFASQGAGRLTWPVLGNLARLAVAALGGALALRWGHGLTSIFIAQGVALVIYALINVAAVAGGAWFGPIGWPRPVTLVASRASV
jgi:Na+-driven multidrug efflux pump